MNLELINEYLRYEPETGKLFWKKRASGRSIIGAEAGCKVKATNGRVYILVTICKIRCMAHKIVWLIERGELPTFDIDHKNGDGTNNYIDNLRIATRSQNIANGSRHSDGKNKYKGITYNKNAKSYLARIMKDGKVYNIGYFKSPEDARDAYVKKSIELFGDFAAVRFRNVSSQTKID